VTALELAPVELEVGSAEARQVEARPRSRTAGSAQPLPQLDVAE
jgi:hypothetical protein